nr:hypothetical protein [uncultured Dyadobacter sp.]
MDTLQSQSAPAKVLHDAAIAQQQLVKDFFLKDTGSELIESLNTLVESYLFTQNLASVTPEMREHIVNQLHVATLIAKLDAANSDISKHSPLP